MLDTLWRKSFEVGHDKIDSEHKIFVSLISEIDECVKAGSKMDRLFRLLNEVGKYAEFHFLSEENIMIDMDYPDYRRHAQIHAGLLRVYGDYVNSLELGEADLGQMLRFTFNWFSYHTLNEDSKIAEFLVAGRMPQRMRL
ncbi:MAG TPA: hemerythrin family protein [Patescibacteria group bacterium]|nr:hemerythrin family protein [Patescibacteria group bacterium]